MSETLRTLQENLAIGLLRRPSLGRLVRGIRAIPIVVALVADLGKRTRELVLADSPANEALAAALSKRNTLSL
jgi:hypothetical protein